MFGNRDFEKSVTGWSAFIIGAGLLLIAAQLGVQLLLDYQVPLADRATTARTAATASSYIGLVVLLAGAILMALVVLTSRWRADQAPALQARIEALEKATEDGETRMAALEAAQQDQAERISSFENAVPAFVIESR